MIEEDFVKQLMEENLQYVETIKGLEEELNGLYDMICEQELELATNKKPQSPLVLGNEIKELNLLCNVKRKEI